MMNAEEFLKKLKAGGYAGVTGARRALSRAGGITGKDMETCKKKIDEYYANETNDENKEDDEGDREEAEERPKKRKAEAKLAAEQLMASVAAPFDDLSSLSVRVKLARKIIEQAQSMLDAFNATHQANPDVDLQEAMEEAVGTMRLGGMLLHQAVKQAIQEVQEEDEDE